MRAVIKEKEGKDNISFCEQWKKPTIEAGEVLIQVELAGVCGTDLKIQSGDYWSNPPVVLGHEYSGIVEAVGADVKDLQPGDRVVSETAQIVCGKCEYCLSGSYLMCKDRLSIGYGTNGAFGEYIAVRREIVHKIPDGVTMEEAALCEPTAVAIHSVFDYAAIKSSDVVLVMGPGTIGQLVAVVVKSLGADVLLCGTEQDRFRLEIAEKNGIPICVIGKEDPVKLTLEMSGGRGADWAFDCSGAAPAISQSLRCLKKQGTLVQVGLTKPEIQIDYGLVAMNELTIKGAFGHKNVNWGQALNLMATKKIDVRPFITHRFSLEEWEQAFEQARELSSIKVLLHP